MLTSRDRDEIAKNAQALIAARRSIGPATACTLIELWLTRKMELTEDEFDFLVGALHDHLERAYDERYRLIQRATKPLRDADEDDEDDDTQF